MAKSSKRNFLVAVQGISGYFATQTGGETASDSSKVYDGGSLTPDVLTAPPDTANIVVSRPYDPDLHATLIRNLRRKVGSWNTTITKRPTDATLAPVGVATVYRGVLIRVGEPEFDASSSDAATWELEFAIATSV